MFHEGKDKAHAYRLYNLKDDIGEKNNLASKFPDRVTAMDKLIENHIRDANVVVPLPNPHFDPAQYKPESIGVQPGGLKVAGKKRPPRKKPRKK